MNRLLLSCLFCFSTSFAAVWNIQSETDFVSSIDSIIENKYKEKEHVLFMTNNIKIFDDNNILQNKIKSLDGITLRIFDSNGQILNQDGGTSWLIDNLLKKTPNNFTPGFGFDLTLNKKDEVQLQAPKVDNVPKQKIILSDDDEQAPKSQQTQVVQQALSEPKNLNQMQQQVNTNMQLVDTMLKKQEETNELIHNANSISEQTVVKQPQLKGGKSNLFKLAINELKASDTDNIINVTQETDLSYNTKKELSSTKMQEPTSEQLNSQAIPQTSQVDRSIIKPLPNNGVVKKGMDEKIDEFVPVLSSKEKQAINYREDEDKSLNKVSTPPTLKREKDNNQLSYDKFVTFQKDPTKKISKVNEDSLIAKFIIAVDSYKKIDTLIDMRDNIPMLSAKNLAQLEAFYNENYSTSDKELKLTLLNTLCQYTQGMNQYYEYKKALGKLLMSYSFSQNHPEVLLAKKTLSILEND